MKIFTQNLNLAVLLSMGTLMTISAEAFDHTHSSFDQVLKSHVVNEGHESVVRYKTLTGNPAALDTYLASVSKVSEAEYGTWTDPQKLAFLINAYNAFTLKLIMARYPVKSIKDLGGIFSSPWKKEFFVLFGKKTYLDHIEHDLIRGRFKEPRIHFALVCASKGCPKLMDSAFTAASLEAQLEQAAQNFLTDTEKNRLKSGPIPVLELSSIFKWYGKDFGADEKALKAYILPRMQLASALMTQAHAAPIRFLDYDWSLNDQSEAQ